MTVVNPDRKIDERISLNGEPVTVQFEWMEHYEGVWRPLGERIPIDQNTCAIQSRPFPLSGWGRALIYNGSEVMFSYTNSFMLVKGNSLILHWDKNGE